MTQPYVELHARSAFSFLRGASPPEWLVTEAARLEIPTMAVCDRDGVYGTVRVHKTAEEKGIKPIVGAELTLDDGSVLPVLVATQKGYQNLCQLITQAKLRGTKKHAPVNWAELETYGEGLVALTGDEEGPLRRCFERDDSAGAKACVEKLTAAFGQKNVYIEIQRHHQRGEECINDQLTSFADAMRLPLLATNGVLHAVADEKEVLDVLTCVRNHTHLDAAGKLLAPNAERFLKNAEQMGHLFCDRPDAIANTSRLADRLEFSLENLGYEFPSYKGMNQPEMDAFLRQVTMAGARSRYSHLTHNVRAQIEKELELIIRLGFSGYFLIVWDLFNFCTENNILCQGRGSAANSAVCYSLGITACDPIGCKLLFERFLSEGRKSWPDIDIDLPSGDRRERVIQEVYRRYGKHGAAMTANVITYRGKSAMREIGKALNFPLDVLNRFSHLFASGDFQHTIDLDAQLQEAGIPVEHPRTRPALKLYARFYGLPRHLGQHSGGMIICQGKLTTVVPLENASMPGRVVAQWDKEDCNDMGMIKVDLLGLGMMAAMQDSLEICSARGRPVDLASIPKDDPATYDLMCRADTIGVFQIESRAQMATLPRMLPKEFYDVVVEVAIIRPGPIQGEMLHPYLERRAGRQKVDYYDPRLKEVLERTLGVPLFQEQLLRIAMVMADFTGGEAEELRRALSFHRSKEKMDKVCVKLRAGMERKGVKPAVVASITKAVQSFAVYGFPESHAISFALIAYASCWLKVHRAPEFLVGLLNNQPMGFYSSATLIEDARRHGVRVRPVSVLESGWLCHVGKAPASTRPGLTAEPQGKSSEGDEDDSVRLGLCFLKGVNAEEGRRIVAEREKQAFASLEDFQLRTALSASTLRVLAKSGALNGLAEHRRDAQWKVEVLRQPDDLFARVEDDTPLPLARMKDHERLHADFASTGLTTGPHPMALWRGRLPDIWRACDLLTAKTGTCLRIAGQVICRQRPGTAKGFVFLSLEDETGIANAIVTPQLFEQMRLMISEEPALIVEGILQNFENVIHIKARTIEPLHTTLPAQLSHDFH